jgi:hypothetical protein
VPLCEAQTRPRRFATCLRTDASLSSVLLLQKEREEEEYEYEEEEEVLVVVALFFISFDCYFRGTLSTPFV